MIERIHLPEIDSTSLEARRRWPPRGDAGTRGLVVVADRQSAGVGREGRAWSSPDGGLWYTLGWLASGGLAAYAAAPVLAGLATAEAIEEVCGVRSLIKWPNDLLVADRKLCGILCQADSATAPAAIFIGIGINGNYARETLTGEFRQPPTTLLSECGHPVDLHRLEAVLTARMGAMLARLPSEGFAPWRDAVLSRLAWVGEVVRSEGSGAGDPPQGEITSIDELGRILLRINGRLVPFHSGELARVTRVTGSHVPHH